MTGMHARICTYENEARALEELAYRNACTVPVYERALKEASGVGSFFVLAVTNEVSTPQYLTLIDFSKRKRTLKTIDL